MYASNNQWELDPDITNCSYAYRKALFATCKNTCPGGEEMFGDKNNFDFLFLVNFPVVAGQDVTISGLISLLFK